MDRYYLQTGAYPHFQETKRTSQMKPSELGRRAKCVQSTGIDSPGIEEAIITAGATVLVSSSSGRSNPTSCRRSLRTPYTTHWANSGGS